MIEYLSLVFLVQFYCKCSKWGLWVYFSQAILTNLEVCLFLFSDDQSREAARWKSCRVQNSVVCILRCVACCEPEWVCTVRALHRDAWGFTRCTSGRGHCSCQSVQPAVKMLSVRSLLGCKEVGKRPAYCDASKRTCIETLCHQVT